MPTNPHGTISGHIVLKSDFPRRLAHINLVLYREKEGDWIHISDFTSLVDGSFQVNQPLIDGKYKIISTDKKYIGSVIFSLDKNSVRDLEVELTIAAATPYTF